MPFLPFSFLLPLPFFLFFCSFSISMPSFHDDPQSLLAFKNNITSDPHGSMADWSHAVPFCNWTAITCSRRHMDRVVSLDLTGMELGGSISPYLGNLTFLHKLILKSNTLHGHIPRPLGRLFRLKTLKLSYNQLKENIPSDLGNCTHLAFLDFSYNTLTGSIPHELGSITHPQQLFLSGNLLTEYGLGGIVSTQGDVYSDGILLLEMFTRKQPTSDMFVGDLNLYNWVNFVFPNRLKEVIDSGLFNEVDGNEFEENNIYKCLISLLRVGLLCSKYSIEQRPTMRVVVGMLENIREGLMANAVASRGLR